MAELENSTAVKEGYSNGNNPIDELHDSLMECAREVRGALGDRVAELSGQLQEALNADVPDTERSAEIMRELSGHMSNIAGSDHFINSFGQDQADVLASAFQTANEVGQMARNEQLSQEQIDSLVAGAGAIDAVAQALYNAGSFRGAEGQSYIEECGIDAQGVTGDLQTLQELASEFRNTK